jgi:nucleoside-diphosphate-sugar epimerase
MHLFIFGAGYSGQQIARALAPQARRVSGTTRSPSHFGALEDARIVPFAFDGTALSQELTAALQTVTHLVLSISPDGGGDPVLPLLAGRKLSDRMPALQWIGYLSTVGVYGDHGGAWVDETTPCRPVSRRSIARRGAEEQWSEIGATNGIPTAIIRLSGIYGPGRNVFVNLSRGTARRLVKPGQVFNRIHLADIAGATALLAERRHGGIWNVTDDEPAPPQDLVTCAARLMGVEPPPEVSLEEADLTPMARSFYGENKRVSNARIKQAGYRFVYPNYRMALEYLWRSGEWKIGLSSSE